MAKILKEIKNLQATPEQKARTKLLVRKFQLQVLQASYEEQLRKQILLTTSLNNLLVDPNDPDSAIRSPSGWEITNQAAWKQYSTLMTMLEDNEDQNAILFNKIITPAV